MGWGLGGPEVSRYRRLAGRPHMTYRPPAVHSGGTLMSPVLCIPWASFPAFFALAFPPLTPHAVCLSVISLLQASAACFASHDLP